MRNTFLMLVLIFTNVYAIVSYADNEFYGEWTVKKSFVCYQPFFPRGVKVDTEEYSNYLKKSIGKKIDFLPTQAKIEKTICKNVGYNKRVISEKDKIVSENVEDLGDKAVIKKLKEIGILSSKSNILRLSMNNSDSSKCEGDNDDMDLLYSSAYYVINTNKIIMNNNGGCFELERVQTTSKKK